jgi:hypothetical protein
LRLVSGKSAELIVLVGRFAASRSPALASGREKSLSRFETASDIADDLQNNVDEEFTHPRQVALELDVLVGGSLSEVLSEPGGVTMSKLFARISDSSFHRVLVCTTLAVGLAVPQAQGQIHLTFTAVNVPAATHTEANGIGGVNGATDIVGFYLDSEGVEHGFSNLNGKMTTINFPGSTGTRAYGIDLNAFYIVGWYTDSELVAHGFELEPSGGFKTVDVPEAVWTRALSVNTDGTIVGAYADKRGIVHGFLDQDGKGTFTTVDFPKAVVTEINSIVNLRYMAGIFVDSSGIEAGVFGADGGLDSTPVDVPGAELTAANGINDETYIVGYYGEKATGPFHGFLKQADQFQTIDFPDASDTRCTGISDSVEIVGRYTDRKGMVHGFIAK